MQPVQPRPAKFVGVAWAALILGIVAVCLIPIPILNNAGAIAAVIGIVLGFVGCFGTRPWLSVLGVFFAGAALLGTIAIQIHWANELDRIQQDIQRDSEQFERQLNQDMQDCAEQFNNWDPATGPAPEC